MSGYYPFFAKDAKEVFEKIINADVHFNHIEFATISEECKDLIKRLLIKNPKKRLNGKEALDHPWFKAWIRKDAVGRENKLEDQSVSVDVINRLRNFKGVSRLKRTAMNVLVKMANEEEVSDLRKQF